MRFFVLFVLSVESALAACPFSSNSTTADLHRAATKVPSAPYRASGFAAMGARLNAHLQAIPGIRTTSCDNFTVPELQGLAQILYTRARPELLALYALQRDPRERSHASLGNLQKTWAVLDGHVARYPALRPIQRDGFCHEAVMWFIHHLSEYDRSLLASQITLPLLPTKRHQMITNTADAASHIAHQAVHADYETKVSCQQCHSGPVSANWVNATLPPPLPVDPVHPGRERQRSCDYQNSPPCGPCEGLGGPRWGDSSQQFSPLNCSVVGLPDSIPSSSRPKAAYPALGQAALDGDTRSPLAVRPDPSKPGKYPTVTARISLAWDSELARHRYDFQHMPPFNGPMSQIYLQRADQIASRNNSGVMVTIIGNEDKISACICMNAIAGNMHIDSFVPHAADDPVDLPASEGGLSYLGRIRLAPIDGGNNNTVVADHYMKWAFHFLVDADPQSPTYGMPVRLYGATGVRMIYSNWTSADPRVATPNLFEIPKHCIPLSKTCQEYY